MFVQYQFKGKVYAAEMVKKVSARYAEVRVFFPEDIIAKRFLPLCPYSIELRDNHWSFLPARYANAG